MPFVHVESGPHAGRRFEIGGEAVVGRLESNAVPLPRDDEASRRHAAFRSSSGRLLLVDLDSRNGTRVNGAKIKQVALADGDVIEIGLSRLRVELEGEAAAAGAAAGAAGGAGGDGEPGDGASAGEADPAEEVAEVAEAEDLGAEEVDGEAAGEGRAARGRASSRRGRAAPPEPDGEGDDGDDAPAAGGDRGEVDARAAAADAFTTRQAIEVLLFMLLCVLVFLDASYAVRIVARFIP